MFEWTTERGSFKKTGDDMTPYDKKTTAVARGGDLSNVGDYYPVSIRDGSMGVFSGSLVVGFRVVLYVK